MMQFLYGVFFSALFVFFSYSTCPASSTTITPFYTFNQSPLVQIYGLPAAESAVVEPPGKTLGLLSFDIANNYASDDNDRETVLLDGESDRLTLALRRGIASNLEIGFDLPLVAYNGGILDGFIEEWHDFFGLPQGNRRDNGHGELLYHYSKDGEDRLRMDQAGLGIGDLRFGAGWQLYHDNSSGPAAVALRASLKLPTGNSSRLRGSGSTDLALWLTGSDDYFLPGSWGQLTLFAAAGGMAMMDGDILKEQQRNLVGFGTLGFGWSPAEWVALKAQFSSHTPFYNGSDLDELSEPAVQLIFGGTYYFSRFTALDIALSEDITVTTSPDFAMHLALSRHF
jgi:hypothetical protein